MKLKAVDLDQLSLRLDQLLNALTDFEVTLDQEANILKSPDISPLTEVVQHKQTLSETVANQFETLSHSLSDEPLSINEYMQLDVFKALPINLQQSFLQLSDVIIRCNNKNTANGLSVQTLSSLNQTLIQLFKGHDLQTKTYTATGDSSTAPAPTKPIGKA